MFPEIIAFIAEEISKQPHLNTTPRRSYLEYAIFQNKFFKGLLSIISVWILATSMIVLVHTFNSIEMINVLTILCLFGLAAISLLLIWRYPRLIYSYLPWVSAVMTITGAAIFFPLININVDFLPLVFFWSFFFLTPSSLFLFVFALAGRKYMRDAWRYYRSQHLTIDDDFQND